MRVHVDALCVSTEQGPIPPSLFQNPGSGPGSINQPSMYDISVCQKMTRHKQLMVISIFEATNAMNIMNYNYRYHYSVCSNTLQPTTISTYVIFVRLTSFCDLGLHQVMST